MRAGFERSVIPFHNAHVILQGEKIILKLSTLRHVPFYWKWIRDNKVTRYMTGAQFPKTYRGEIRWFRNMKKKKDEKLFVILDAATKKPIGSLGIHQISHFNEAPRVYARGASCERKARARSEAKNLALPVLSRASSMNRKAGIGIMIGEKKYWNKGYGTDAMKTALRYCFQNLRLNKVTLTVDVENKRGVRCYEKCGFVKVGFLKDDARRTKNGPFQNSFLMEAFANRSKKNQAIRGLKKYLS